jgi:hypothetical protein
MYRHYISSIVLIIAGMIACCSSNSLAAEPTAPIWIKRIWERKLDAGTIVVDLRRYPEGAQPGGPPAYVWRLIKPGESDGKILYERDADFSRMTGIKPEEKPITVLFADIVNGDLITVFNQCWEIHGTAEKSWAIRVHRDEIGQFITAPNGDIRPDSTTDRTSMLGPPMKSAEISVAPNGHTLVSGLDSFNQKFVYELSFWTTHIGQEEHKVYYWRLVEFWAAPFAQ